MRDGRDVIVAMLPLQPAGLNVGPVANGSEEIKLLCLINSLGPGGAERSLVELLPFCVENDIRPTVVCLRRRGTELEESVRRLGCEVRFLPTTGGLIGRVHALRRMIEPGRVDLVHTTLFEADIAGRLAAAGRNVPVLTSLVNTSYDPVRLKDPNVSRLGLWGAKRMDAWTARHLTSHFHAITRAVRDSAVRELGIEEARVTVVERGRDVKRLGRPSPERRLRARRRLDLSDDDEVLVNVGREEYQKGQKFLLRAAASLTRRRPRLVVLVAGRKGHCSDDLRRLRKQLGLVDRIRFLGEGEDVGDLLAAADVFVFPSVYEGLGGAVIEAMALGLPIVASDLPALREVVEDGRNGLLVEPESPEALARAISRILDEGSLAGSFGARSREIYGARFTIERSAQQMIDLYRLVIEAGRSGSGASGAARGWIEPRRTSRRPATGRRG